MLVSMIKKLLIITWLTLLSFMLLANVHAWEVPSYLRLTSGSRLWFTNISGDLIQPDRTKIGIIDNLGVTKDQLTWEFLLTSRVENIHVARVKFELPSLYGQSDNGSSVKIYDVRAGYDLDFYMTPQALFGLNVDVDAFNIATVVNNVRVGSSSYNYSENRTRVLPSLGLHGSFYPILQGIALRPNLSARVNWWDYESVKTWDWEVSAAVDIPVNPLWTWSMNGGYRMWNIRTKRDKDEVDVTRNGFFVETSVRF